ncbi:MAG: uridine kinase [Clostridiales bacterium]|nr:uridine kinase [Clostridiales bacterium]
MNDTAPRLVTDLRQLAQTYGRAMLVIDGDCAAGKTTLAAQVAARLDSNVFHMDDFFLPPALRTEERLNEVGGNVHYERFMEQVLKPLQTNKPFVYGAYSCIDFSTINVSVTPKPCAIVEGSYALHPRFLDAYRAMDAILVFMRLPKDEQIKRIRTRNGEAMLRRFKEEWIPMEKRYHKAFQSQWDGVRFTDG